MSLKQIKFEEFKKFDRYFLIYLISLFFFGFFSLYYKHNVGNDSSISEYLINYQGGFVRRGLIGEILFVIGKNFHFNLRFLIFLFQSSIYLIFLILIYNLFKKFKKNILILFAIYSPIFLLFPISEIESLGRKEMVMYVFFLTLINIKNAKNANVFTLAIMPFVCMIYEQITLFSPFIYAVLIIKNKTHNFKSAFKLLFLFIPSLIIILIFLYFPQSREDHKIMIDQLLNVFNERCYMSCMLLNRNDIVSASGMIGEIWGSWTNIKVIFIRYFLIFLAGFFPILFLSYYSNFKSYNIFCKLKLKNIFILLIFFYITIIPLFILGADWGRWIGMTITYTTIFYFYLYKNNLISVNYTLLSKKLFFLKNKRKLVIILFVLYSFGWNQKTTSTEDISTNALYKVPYNTAKRIFGWNSFRLFQNTPFIKLHKKYLE